MFEGKSYEWALTNKRWTLKKPDEWVTKKSLNAEWYNEVFTIPGTYYSDMYAGSFQPVGGGTASRADEIAELQDQVDKGNELIELFGQLKDTLDDDQKFDLKVKIEALKTVLGYEDDQ